MAGSLSIGGSIRLFSAVAAGALVVASGISFLSLEELRVGGPSYRQIVAGKDLVADILPPPEYVIEADLEATLLHDKPGDLGERRARLAKLQQDFEARRDYWRKSSLPADLKASAETSAQAAAVFWSILNQDMLPAVARGDTAGTDAAYARLQAAYGRHRAAVDALVVRANAFSANAEVRAEKDKALFMALELGAAAAALVVLLIGGVLITRRVARPLVGMADVMKRLAAGELEAQVPSLGRRDEVGAMAAAVEVFKTAGQEKQRLEAEAQSARDLQEAERAAREHAGRIAAEQQAEVIQRLGAGLASLSDGDLTCAISPAFAPDYESLRGDFNQALERLRKTVEVIAGATEGILGGVSEISLATDQLARRTEQQAAGLEETAAALDEITQTVRRTADTSASARASVQHVKAQAESNKAVVAKTVSAMGEIDQSSRAIEQIVGVIDEIAFQTNLLALNAGVEAARAGEFGRGFAVVATEVRALSQRSATAARDIKALIQSASSQVGQGVDLVGETGKVLDRIMGDVGAMAQHMAEISASTQEQSTALSQVNTAVNQMDQATQQNAAMVEETAAATSALKEEAQALSRLVSTFTLTPGDEGASRSQAGPGTRPQLRAV